MNAAYLFGALIIVMGEAVASEGANGRQAEEQRVLLRKLQNFQRNEVNNETVTWNEILADILVKNIKVFSKNEEQPLEKSRGVFARFVSDFLYVSKSIYDVFKNDNTEEEIQDHSSTTENNPKREIEKVNTVIRNGDCDDCDEMDPGVDKVGTKCPNGYYKNKDGNCEDPVSSKIIMAIPYQCPVGYRPDRRGYCRFVYQF